MKDDEKIVQFDKYCKLCTHKDLPEEEDPCYYCLCYDTNTNSHKPVYYEENKYHS